MKSLKCSGRGASTLAMAADVRGGGRRTLGTTAARGQVHGLWLRECTHPSTLAMRGRLAREVGAAYGRCEERACTGEELRAT